MANRIVQEIRQMIEDYLQNSRWTSANPAHINTLLSLQYNYEPDPEGFRDDKEPREPVQPLKSGMDFPSLAGAKNPNSLLNALKDPLGSLEKFLPFAKLIPYIGLALAAPEIIKKIADFLRDSLIIDIRFKRNIQGEVFQSLERDKKARIRQGLDIIRITSSKTQRGETGIGHSGQVGLSGIANYDQDFDAFRKGVI